MKPKIRKCKRNVLLYAGSTLLLATLCFAVTHETRQLAGGEKATVTGAILSRDGDLIRILDKKSSEVVVVDINEDTKIERKQHRLVFFRHTDMDVTAMVPGLTIQAEGLGNSKGRLDAAKIVFTPDSFAVEVAQEQQALENKAAVQNAQSTADLGFSAASLAQASAAHAQDSADQAGTNAEAASDLAIGDAEAAVMLNQRVSELDDYKNEFEVDVFFAEGSAVLNMAAKRDLANLADIAKSLDGYMIEISGYAAHHKFSLQKDQSLSEERAAAVARYLREAKDIPMRRVLVPVGYGATHPVASNQNPHGRDLNRHVDIKVLVNKHLGQDASQAKFRAQQ
jgi:outer membrane protein OmpA-like peptidoglycan-associated protein